MINTKLLSSEEKIIYRLRSLFEEFGYAPYRMSKFEEYDFYVRNKDFLLSEDIITFTDTNGKLLALKPDVTLSIARNSDENQRACQKVYYDENVYRVSPRANGFKEMLQTGVECIGSIGNYEIFEMICLAARSLNLLNPQYILDISHLGVISALLGEMQVSADQEKKLLGCLASKNSDGIRKLCTEWVIDSSLVNSLIQVISIYGSIITSVMKLKSLCVNEKMADAVSELEEIAANLEAIGGYDDINLDFSLISDMNYYSGIVFQGFLPAIPEAVLSGGRYDLLMKRMGNDLGAIGFAVYIDNLERLEDETPSGATDAALLYSEESITDIARAARSLRDRGLRVRVLREKDCSNNTKDLQAKNIYLLKDGEVNLYEDD